MSEARASLGERDRRTLWHPFTQMGDWLDGNPVVIERGEGNYLIDTEQRRYFDGVSSLWVNLHGHDHPLLRARLHAQIDRIAHSTLLGLSAVPPIELAEKLVALAPAGLTRVFFSDNGSTAMEIALKLAFQFWQQQGDPAARARTRFVTFEHAYHGDTLGAVSVGGIDAFHARFAALCFPVLRASNTQIGSLERILSEHGREVAAVCIEPLLQAAGGMLTFPSGFLRRARELCDAAGTLLIADEVATGFGRTGRMFACEHEGVTPDLLALAKSLTAGFLPLGATLASERIFEGFLGPVADSRQFFHGHSYTGNALGCAAALANLEIFEREAVLERIQPLIAQLARGLAELAQRRTVGDVRQVGLMAGVDLVPDRASGARFDPAERVGHLVCLALRAHGVMLRPLGDTLVIMPPLSTSAAELDHMLDALSLCIAEVTGG
jgi:adenosylmethionine-8-amino-7-oxononanoate aminotransferase